MNRNHHPRISPADLLAFRSLNLPIFQLTFTIHGPCHVKTWCMLQGHGHQAVQSTADEQLT